MPKKLLFQYENLLDKTLQALLQAGADSAEVKLTEEDNFEVYGTAMSLNLVRSVENSALKLSVIKDAKKASATVNDLSDTSIQAAIENLISAAKASEADPANAFSSLPDRAGETLEIGPQPDQLGDLSTIRQALTHHLADFLDHTCTTLPNLMLSELGGQYNYHKILLKNSLGTHLRESQGKFEIFTLFNAVDETKSSSFNYVASSPVGIDTPLAEDLYWQETLQRSTQELNPIAFEGTLSGNVVFAPSCVTELLYYAQDLALSDESFIKGFSKWQGKIGETVADPKLTWQSLPTHPAVGGGYGITEDGFVAEDASILENGVLTNYALTLYGANKTGEKRSPNPGHIYYVERGETPFEEMISKIERGVLVLRLSGGQPSPNGDFSGIAKNSFLIENGKVTQAITEAMATFNLFEVLNHIDALSDEVHNGGNFYAPYMLTHKVQITGA